MAGELQRAVCEKWRVHCITVLYSMCMFGHVALIIFFFLILKSCYLDKSTKLIIIHFKD